MTLWQLSLASATHIHKFNEHKFYISWCSAYTKFDLRTSVPHSILHSCVPAFTVTLYHQQTKLKSFCNNMHLLEIVDKKIKYADG